MSINVEKKAIFIHVPKTGGTSISKVFQESIYIAKHISYIEAENNMDTLDDWFTFSFVRNPWDRLYSQYVFTCQRKLSDTEIPIPQKYYTDIGFKNWVLGQHTWWNIQHANLSLPAQRQNQIDWLINSNGNLTVDYIGKFERLQEDWDIICDKINLERSTLPVTNKTIRFDDYRLAYDDETREYVNTHFKRDIDEFQYEF